MFFQMVEHAEPDGGYTGRHRNVLALIKLQQAFLIKMWSGKNQFAADHGGGVWQSPSIHVKHGDDGQKRVGMANGKVVRRHQKESVEENGSVGVDHAFGNTCRA